MDQRTDNPPGPVFDFGADRRGGGLSRTSYLDHRGDDWDFTCCRR